MLACGEKAPHTPLVFFAIQTPRVRPASVGLVWKRTVIQVPGRTIFVARLKPLVVWPTAVSLAMVTAAWVPPM